MARKVTAMWSVCGLACTMLLGCKSAALPDDAAVFEEAFASGDPEQVAELYADDAILMPPNGSALSGRDEILAHWRSMTAEPTKLSMRIVETVSEGDLAYRRGEYELKDAQGTPVDRGKYLEIWKPVGGDWKIHRDIYNSDLPPPPTPLPEREVARIQAALRAQGKHLQDGDLDAWVALYKPDGVLMAPNQPSLKGRMAIQGYAEALGKINRVQISEIDVVGRSDLAVATSALTLTFPLAQPGATGQDSAKHLTILERQPDGTWQISVASHNSNLSLDLAEPQLGEVAVGVPAGEQAQQAPPKPEPPPRPEPKAEPKPEPEPEPEAETETEAEAEVEAAGEAQPEVGPGDQEGAAEGEPVGGAPGGPVEAEADELQVY